MLTGEIIAAAGCGGLVAAVGLALWGGLRGIPDLDRAVGSIRWIAAVVLMFSVLLQVYQGNGLSTLLFLASVGAPAPAPMGRNCRWSSSLSLAPALILAGASLFTTVGPWAGQPGESTVTSARGVAFLVCGGMGMRAFAAHLMSFLRPIPLLPGKLTVATYRAVTLLLGGLTLASLSQRGTVWDQSAQQARLAQAWLICAAAMFIRGEHPKLRSGLMLLGTGSLVWIVSSIR